MYIKNAFKSMKWKLVLVYCLLVFITMTVIGVIIVNKFEEYHISLIKGNLVKTLEAGTLISSLEKYDDLDEMKEQVQENIDAWSRTIQEEIFVVDKNYYIIASNNTKVDKTAFSVLEGKLILKTFETGESQESFGEIQNLGNNIPVLNMTFPIKNEETVNGIIYIRTDMQQIYDIVSESKEIFLQTMMIGLLITVILGIFIAKSIIEPIEDVRKKAEKMANGDFSQYVEVKSEDEIGHLAEMFNYLTTQLEETLLKISEEENKLHTILKYMVDGIVAINLQGEIIHANPSAIRILKMKGDGEEKNYNEIIQNFSDELNFEKLKNNIVEEENSFLVKNKDGEKVYLARYDWVKDEENNNTGIILILQDITQRQNIENMQKDFVANVSHELKTPLTTIKSYTETLLDGVIEEKDLAKEFLKTVDIEAERMNRLVKELLQLSKLDYQSDKIVFKQLDIVSVLNTALKKVEITANLKGQNLIYDFSQLKEISVLMNRDGIEQVFLNILSNAIKYTNENGDIKITVTEKQKNVEIIVEDNGIGIPEADKGRVFERFFRVDKARSRAVGGTGLGLSISKQIVENHKGSIDIESVDREGTSVILKFPLAIQKGIKNIE